MMRIGIDGRYIQDHFPGIGRYTYSLIGALAQVAGDESFIVLHNPALRNTRYDLAALARHPNVTLVPVNVPTFSTAEQTRLPWVVRRLRLDVLHSPYYIKPYLLPCPSVVSLYDLIAARYPEYLPSSWARLAFAVTTRLAITTARRLITLSAASRRDLETRGIYLTTALKCAKVGYGVGRSTVKACSRLLEEEIGLFPGAAVIMLMGDTAIGAYNAIARRRTGKGLIPSGPTWKARAGEYWFEGKRVFPSYLQTGRSYLIERSKRDMIAADLRAALALIGG